MLTVYFAGTGLLTAAVFYERPVVSSISLLSIAAGVPVYYPGPLYRPVTRPYSAHH